MKRYFVASVLIITTLLSGCSNSELSGSDYMSLYEQANSNGQDDQALEYLKQAAASGDSMAESRLGEAYLHQRYGLDNPELGENYIRSAAEKGEPRAMTNLGILYLNGEVVKKDYNQAFEWFTKAAAKGDIKAPRYLGLIYENGWGKDVDYIKAAENYQLAADRGDITGQYQLGKLYESGLGVKKDYEKAIVLYNQSAARGDIVCLPAIMALGNVYEQGIGVDKNLDQALVWYSKAADLGDKSAKAKIGKYQYPDNPEIMDVSAVVEVIGDGQKVGGLAVEYTDDIDPHSLQTSDFKVNNREISSVYVSNKAVLGQPSETGTIVIVELKTEIDPESSQMGGGPKKDDGSENAKNEGTGPGGPKMGQISDKSPDPIILTSSVTQTGEINFVSGKVIAATENVLNTNRTLNPDIAGFNQLIYHDGQFNKDLMYNLFVPKNYDPKKSYPLVLFMHDAGVVSNNHIETLTQGLGSVIWASDKDQSLNESFVLAPQYNSVMTDDTGAVSDDMDITVNLIRELTTKYSIDTNRLYNTGQSMGGMISIAMDIKYPDLFAASFLVACQWDPELVKPLANKPLWIVVSEGDNKANPGMDAITDVLSQNGATIAKANWNAEASPNELKKDVEVMLSQDASVNYAVFKGGSHRYTWQYAYSIDGIRQWLFKQHK
jgi:predicted peptidase/TPR repeat protein